MSVEGSNPFARSIFFKGFLRHLRGFASPPGRLRPQTSLLRLLFPLVPFGADLGFFATPGGKAKRMASALEVRGIDRLCAQKSSSFAIKPFVLRHFRSQLKIAPPVATARRPQRHMLSSSGREYATHHQRRGQRRGRIGPDRNVACHGDDSVLVAVREARKDH